MNAKISRHLVESAALIFVNLENGLYRCYKSDTAAVIQTGIYTLDFVRKYAQSVPNVIIVKEAQLP